MDGQTLGRQIDTLMDRMIDMQIINLSKNYIPVEREREELRDYVKADGHQAYGEIDR